MIKKSLCGLFLVAALAPSARAADKLRLERLDFPDPPTMRVFITATDPEGRVVSGRTKEEIKLVLDGAEQGAASQLVTFDTVNEPVNIIALVQVSQAMLDVADDVKKGVKLLANALPPRSKMALLAFSSDTKRLAEMGSPVDSETAANQLVTDTEYVEVHLLDALRTAVDILNSAPAGQRKLIVLFSDGIDANMERKSFFSVGKRAVEAGVVIDTIGYAPFEPARLRNLTELTKQSNGGERACKSGAEVSTEFGNVADEIRKQYVATYELTVAGGDGKMHTIQVSTEAEGHIAFSNNVIRPVPKPNHKPRSPSSGRRWWLWALCIVGGVCVVMLIVWLIFREKDEPPMSMSAPEPQNKPRTMAMSVGDGGRVSAVGWLVVINGRQSDKTFPLKSGRTVIGTASDCDVVIEDQFASSRHAEVKLAGNAFSIIDLGSTNGMLVNDRKTRDHELVDNDRIVIGRTELKFKSVVQ